VVIAVTRSLTFTAFIALVRFLGIVDIVIPFDDDFAPSAVSPLTGGDPTVPAWVSFLELAPDRNLIAGIVVDLQLALAQAARSRRSAR
jgi:hypothetical protein